MVLSQTTRPGYPSKAIHLLLIQSPGFYSSEDLVQPKRHPIPCPRIPFLSQYVQVDRRGFHHGEQHLLNVFDVEALLGLPLPAAQHHVVDLLGTEPGALQDPALSDALDHLEGRGHSVTQQAVFPRGIGMHSAHVALHVALHT